MNFEEAVEHILRFEGGYVWNEKDPGGETNFGISKRSYPFLEIKSLNRAAAAALYRRDFWDSIKLDLLPPPLRLMVFDTAVNQGPFTAISILQNALYVAPDGLVGLKTLEALANENLEIVLVRYVRLRLKRYFSTNNFETFGEGWLKRLLDVAMISARLL